MREKQSAPRLSWQVAVVVCHVRSEGRLFVCGLQTICKLPETFEFLGKEEWGRVVYLRRIFKYNHMPNNRLTFLISPTFHASVMTRWGSSSLGPKLLQKAVPWRTIWRKLLEDLPTYCRYIRCLKDEIVRLFQLTLMILSKNSPYVCNVKIRLHFSVGLLTLDLNNNIACWNGCVKINTILQDLILLIWTNFLAFQHDIEFHSLMLFYV